jgi:hypothetical protein
MNVFGIKDNVCHFFVYVDHLLISEIWCLKRDMCGYYSEMASLITHLLLRHAYGGSNPEMSECYRLKKY